MNGWEQVKLGDLYSVHNGISKGKQFFGKGYPFLSFSTVFNNWFLPLKLDSLVESTEQEQSSYSIKRGDVFVTRTSETMDELGMSSVALNDFPNATYNGFTKRLRPITNKVLPEFIGYYLRSPKFRGKFMAFSSMTTRASLSNAELLSLQIELPCLKVQYNIATILRSYDNLIDNYRRQIELMEESAQRLYKEWFVSLRFPGYEHTKIVDGVPKGWKKSNVGSLCTLRKSLVSTDKLPTDCAYIGLEHMPRIDFCLSKWGKVDSIASSKYRYKEDDIIFGKIRPYFHKVGFAINEGVVSSDSFVMTANKGYWAILLMTVFDKAFVDYTYQTCKEGAKMPRADWKYMKAYKVLIPSESIRMQFEDYVWNISRLIKSIALQNNVLTEARDRLLPRLMSGEIKV